MGGRLRYPLLPVSGGFQGTARFNRSNGRESGPGDGRTGILYHVGSYKKVDREAVEAFNGLRREPGALISPYSGSARDFLSL